MTLRSLLRSGQLHGHSLAVRSTHVRLWSAAASSSQTVASSEHASACDTLHGFLQQAHVALLDVRSREEFALGSAKGALNVPVESIPDLMHKLPEDLASPVVVFCAAGKRATLAKTFLRQVGYSNVVNGGSVGDIVDALKVGKPSTDGPEA